MITPRDPADRGADEPGADGASLDAVRHDSHEAVEERLRDAVDAYAETVEASMNAWSNLSSRLDRPGRSSRRAVISVFAGAAAIAAVIALVVVMTRGGRDPVGSVDMRPAGSTEAPSPTTATTTASTTTATTTTALTDVSVYFIRDEKVGVLRRSVDAAAPAAAAVRALLDGPTADEQALGFRTNIPDGTTLNGVVIADGVATVDLSATYESGGGSLSMTTRLAEVVFTLTQFPTVKAVSFELDGVPVTTLGGEGIMIDQPVGRTYFPDATPMILVESPAPGDVVSSPLTIKGFNNTFEAGLAFRIEDAAGQKLAEGFTTGSGPMGEWGTFVGTLDFDRGAATEGKLVVFERSAKDGTEVNVVEIPVRF